MENSTDPAIYNNVKYVTFSICILLGSAASSILIYMIATTHRMRNKINAIIVSYLITHFLYVVQILTYTILQKLRILEEIPGIFLENDILLKLGSVIFLFILTFDRAFDLQKEYFIFSIATIWILVIALRIHDAIAILPVASDVYITIFTLIVIATIFKLIVNVAYENFNPRFTIPIWYILISIGDVLMSAGIHTEILQLFSTFFLIPLQILFPLFLAVFLQFHDKHFNKGFITLFTCNSYNRGSSISFADNASEDKFSVDISYSRANEGIVGAR